MHQAPMSEFGLIGHLTARLARQQTGLPPGAESPVRYELLGPGDDAALWRAGDALEAATTDTMVDGVHFVFGHAEAQDIGWKAIASNVSDIGAMGLLPDYALVTLGLRADIDSKWIDSLYDGLLECGGYYGVRISGGDIVGSAVPFVSVTVIGHTAYRDAWRDSVLLRSAARPGDGVYVSGTLGGSAGGLELVLRNRTAGDLETKALLEAHYRPRPPLGLGPALVGVGVRCGMDLSDGLAGDLLHICEASGVSAMVDFDALPAHPALAADAFRLDARRLAATGGEDYQLLFTASPASEPALRSLNAPITRVGEIVAGAPTISWRGLSESAELRSFDHFLAEHRA